MDSSSDTKNFPWPSTVNFANFVTLKPSVDGDDFKIWKEQMTCLLESQDVLSFVDGETLPPSPVSNADQKKQWRRTDRLVKGWILGSIGKHALDSVWEKPTARDVWLELENIFKKEEVAEKFVDETREDHLRNIYLALYKAAQRGDWETAHKLFRDYKLDIATVISGSSKTALHVAVQTGNSNHFVMKMVELMRGEDLALKDSDMGSTALHLAAVVGNTEAAAMMIDKNPDLLYIRDKNNRLAVLQAAVFCHKGTLEYLISKSSSYIFEGQLGVGLLNIVIASEFYDVALDMVHKYPNLATLVCNDYNSTALSTLAENTYAFLSGESFSWWKMLIYYCIPIRMSKQEPANPTDVHVTADIENTAVKKKVENEVLKIIQVTMPSVWAIRKKKAVHQQALELVNYLCQQILTLPEKEASRIFGDSLIFAAKNGIREIVEVIMEMYPEVTFTLDGATGGTIFHLAASHRFENVFSLIYSMTDRKHLLYDNTDYQDNNLMHICGKLAPPHRLNLVPGAALQMQRELHWFKEMENFVHPSRRTWLNNNNQNPKMIFTNEHKHLKAEGERWMKDTANACTIAAALIATVMFTAAFTLPGGLAGDTGVPIFLEQPSFILFAISDAVSLFTSITSLLMFLSILTSRYAEEDFLYVLPKRLSIGLFSLFVSITFMLVAFSATMYLVFRGRVPWFLLPAAMLTCLPVASFVLLQFPLLVDVVYSTYGSGIFGRKTDRVFH